VYCFCLVYVTLSVRPGDLPVSRWNDYPVGYYSGFLGGAWACCLACFRFYSRSCFQACSPCCCPDFPWVYSRYSCCCSLSGCFSGYYGFWSDFVCLDFVFSRQNDSSFLLPPRPCNRCSLVLLFRHRQLLPEFVPV